MKRTRLLLLATAALLLAGITSYGVYQVLQKAAAIQDDQVVVVVATQDLQSGMLLNSNHLKQTRVNKSTVPANAIRSLQEAEGRGLLYPVARNEMVLETKLAPKEAGAGLPSMIPAGMRAVSVKVNEVVSVAGFVLPGTRVDVLLTGSPDQDRNAQNVTTTTVLENVQVLAAGTQLQQNAKGEPQKVPVITLLVSPEDAQRLTLAAAEGRIQLSLRNPMDKEQEKPTAVKTQYLYAGAAPAPAPKKKVAAKAPTPLPPPTPQIYLVEMIRGDKRDQVKF